MKGINERLTHNLEFHGLSIKFNGPNLEVHTNRANVALGVGIVRKTQEETRLVERACVISRIVQESDGDCGGIHTLPTPESPMRRSLKR